MSGLTRSNSSASRRTARRHTALPYSRPAPKKSSWAWTDVFKMLNPLRALSPSQDEEESEAEESESEPAPSNAARALSIRGREMLKQSLSASSSSEIEQQASTSAARPPTASHEQRLPGNQTSPDPQNPSSLLDQLISQGSNNKAVEDFLRSKGDQPLTRIEYAGVLALLAGRVEAEPEEKDVPFRFSTTSLSPEPAQAINFTPGSASNGGRKMLTKNPNGSYVLRGGGSARPRNRYHSPGFGPSQRTTTPIRITPEKPSADGKRRRIGYDPDLRPASSSATLNGTPNTNGTPSPVAGPSSPSPNTSPTIQAVPRAGAPPPTTPIRRRSILPTTPVNPSPLRQAWGQPDSPPSQSSPPSAGKQTQSAAYLSQLIKDISPKKNPDIQNPYQASSVLPRPATKKPPQRRRTEPAKTAPKPAPEKSKSKSPPTVEPTISSVDAIVATMPTGSKRARPPRDPDARPILNGSLAASPLAGSSTLTTGPSVARRVGRSEAKVGPRMNGATSKPAVEVHEISDDEDESPQKKQKTKAPTPTMNGHSRPKRPSVEIEEVPDVDTPGKPPSYTLPAEIIEPDEGSKAATRGPSPTSTMAPPAPFRIGVPGSGQDRFRKFAPARPSSLRNQVSVDKDDAPEPMAPPPAPRPAFAIPKLSARPVPIAKPAVQQSKVVTAAAPKDAKAIVLAKSVGELPTFTLTVIATRLDVSQLAKHKARSLPQAKLPTYDLKALSSPGAGPSSSANKAPAAAASASKGFNWAAAGMAKPTPKPEGSWACSICMCTNDAKATEKCAVCEAPRPGAPKAPTTGFNWGAAGMAKPKAKEGAWTCSLCMCSNGAEVTEKCKVCEAPRPR